MMVCPEAKPRGRPDEGRAEEEYHRTGGGHGPGPNVSLHPLPTGG